MLDQSWPFGYAPPPETAAGVSRKAAIQWRSYWHHLITNIARSGGVATYASWSLWFDDATVARQSWKDAIHDGWWESIDRVRGLPECGRLTTEGYAYVRALGFVPARRSLVAVDTIPFAERVLMGALNATQWRLVTQPNTADGFYQTTFPATYFKSPQTDRLQHVGNQAIQSGLSLIHWYGDWMWVLLDVRQRQLRWTVNWVNRTLRELQNLGVPFGLLLIASPWRQDIWTDAEAVKMSRNLPRRLSFQFPESAVLDVVHPWRNRSRSTHSVARPVSMTGQSVATNLLETLRAQRTMRPVAVRQEVSAVGQHS